MAGRVTVLKHLLTGDSGSMPVVIALSLAGLVSFASMAIDIGYAMATKAGMQTVAKAAVLAGARELGRIYEGQTYTQQASYQLTTSDRARVTTAVRDIAGQNPVMGQSLNVSDGDIQVGRWDAQSRTFAAGNDRPNAVSVTARKDGSSNGPVTFFLAHVMGITSLNLTVRDIAALGAIGAVPPGELDVPVAISKAWFDRGKSCGDQIKFYPTGTLEGCAGWHTFEESPANASTLKDILKGLKNGTYTTPAAIFGQTQFTFTGGTVASVFDEMEALYNAKKDAHGEWNTFLPVFDHSDCSNPNGAITIVGFTSAVVTQVMKKPDKVIQAHIQCNEIQTGRPGGPDYGTLSSVPTIVQSS
jgi:hypothetical protein